MGKDILLYAVALTCSFIAGIVTAKIADKLSGRNNGHDYDNDGSYDDDDYDDDYEDDDYEDGEEEEEEYFDDEDPDVW
jgi:hypothetical protein